MSEHEQEQSKVAMVIVAHPDDAEFGAAGTIATWVRDEWDAYYVICTDASGGGPDDATDVGPEARRKISETRKPSRAGSRLSRTKWGSWPTARPLTPPGRASASMP